MNDLSITESQKSTKKEKAVQALIIFVKKIFDLILILLIIVGFKNYIPNIDQFFLV
jgi:hypothetical protein